MAEPDREGADDAAPPAPAPPKTAGLRKILIPALVLIGVLVLAGGAYFAGRMSTPHDESADADEPAEAPAAKAGKVDKAAKTGKVGAKSKGKSGKAPVRVPIYWALDPPFVVNYQDDQVLRYLQLGVQVMAYEPETIDLLKANEPLARNALLLLFGDQQFASLITRAGKDKLRELALAELRKIVVEQGGKSGPESVYFTSFVMQ